MTLGDELPGYPPDPPTNEQPVPAAVFRATVARLESEIEKLRAELAATHAELSSARDDVRRVLLLLEASAKSDGRIREALARLITTFADDAKVRLLLAGGLIVVALGWAGVTGLSWQDGTLSITPTEKAAPSPMPPGAPHPTR
jgi:hypothetical protein